MPVLSVIMPVYNGGKYVKEAIESILNQTYTNYELIIIDDGSTDNSLEIISKFQDKRIKVFENVRNYGVAFTRNRGLCEAKGRYIAWCDCDDISLSKRFEVQIGFLEKNPSIGACGTWLCRYDTRSSYTVRSYQNPEIVKATLLFKPSMLNATVMLRAAEIRKNRLYYNINLAIAEDYDFILRCSRYFQLTNIPMVLYKYRASDTSIMKKYEQKDDEKYAIHKLVYQHGLKALCIAPSEEELSLHWMISSDKLFTSFDYYEACYKWLCYLKEVNAEVGLYEKKEFERVLADQFLFISKKASKFGLKTLWFYLAESYRNFGYVSSYATMKLGMRCCIRYNKF